MDGLIPLLIVYFIAYYIIKRIKGLQGVKNPKSEPVLSDAPQPASPKKRGVGGEKKAPVKRDVISPKAPEAPYQPIQPTLLQNHEYFDYTGSMGAPSGEGQASTEGVASTEGGEVFSPEVLNTANLQYGTELAPDVLPENWDGDTIVRAMVMHEIFNRPHRWSGNHG